MYLSMNNWQALALHELIFEGKWSWFRDQFSKQKFYVGTLRCGSSHSIDYGRRRSGIRILFGVLVCISSAITESQ